MPAPPSKVLSWLPMTIRSDGDHGSRGAAPRLAAAVAAIVTVAARIAREAGEFEALRHAVEAALESRPGAVETRPDGGDGSLPALLGLHPR